MLVARAQLDFVRDLIARFGREDGVMRPVAEYQSQYVAIVALLRSVGHVFDKIDCIDTNRRTWSKEKWAIWKREPIFCDFIEPARNALLKEFQGGLELHGEAFGSLGAVADLSVPDGASCVAAFDANLARDFKGRLVLQQFHAAVAFWDHCIREAEVAFADTVQTTH